MEKGVNKKTAHANRKASHSSVERKTFKTNDGKGRNKKKAMDKLRKIIPMKDSMKSIVKGRQTDKQKNSLFIMNCVCTLQRMCRTPSMSFMFVTPLSTEKNVTGDLLKKRPKSLDKSVPQSSPESSKKETQDGCPDIQRNKKGELVFTDFPIFRPNMSPKEVLQAGSFGGTYFRPIYSSVTKQNYKDMWKELPEDWLRNLDTSKQVASQTYRMEVNTYKVKCGGSLEMWESSGWIVPQDPYGWFQWYCRFYQGRRTEDDERQVGRWSKCTGPKGRWKNNLITKIVRSGSAFDNPTVSPVVRQTLQHWGYRLTKEDYEVGAKRVKS